MKVIMLTRKKLLVVFSCFLAGVMAAVVGTSTASKVVETVSEEREIPIYYVDRTEKVCALSFDAAWGNEQTETLLDILDEYGVKSTFFLVKQWVDKFPESVEDIARRGHDVGNHSATHPHMSQLSMSGQEEEIAACNDAIEEITGTCPTLFRAPYGEYNNTLVECTREMGMYCVQWNIDSLDWMDPTADEIVKRIGDNLVPGSIILLHNGATNTPEALPAVIEEIKRQGYEIVPISQILLDGEYDTEHDGKMVSTE